MKFFVGIILPLVLLSLSNSMFALVTTTTATDTLLVSGLAAGWGHYNLHHSPHAQLGARYIPAFDYRIPFKNDRKLDFKASANLFGSLATIPFDTLSTDGSVKPYRFWCRYSTRQLEIRMGLQKLNFGTASMLRPLMWFDQIDPRDPLQLTDGLWGLLGRYYFLNNANLWLWCLYGNDKSRPWSIGKSSNAIPEPGARLQYPVPTGEMAFSYHFRMADTRKLGNGIPELAEIPEHRIGIDGRFDLKTGLWFEGVWIHKGKNTGIFTNQEILNMGFDYTFAVGNGFSATFEQLLYASDEKAFAFRNPLWFSALSLRYPAGIADNFSAIVFYDRNHRNVYNFINWNHTFENIALYLMAFWNPEKYNLPQQNYSGNLFAGPGFQIMLVYHY